MVMDGPTTLMKSVTEWTDILVLLQAHGMYTHAA